MGVIHICDTHIISHTHVYMNLRNSKQQNMCVSKGNNMLILNSRR